MRPGEVRTGEGGVGARLAPAPRRARGQGGPDRRGTALLGALVALVVAGVLAMGAHAIARGALADARGSLAGARALAAADGALARLRAVWEPGWSLPAPTGARIDVALDGPAGAAAVHLVRLDTNRYVAVAEAGVSTGSAGAGALAVRRVARLVRLGRVLPSASATLTSGGPLTVPGDARVTGGDGVPAGWGGCGAAGGGVAAIAVGEGSDTAQVAPTAVDAGGMVVTAAARAAATYDVLGDESWASLAARATVTLDAGGVHSPLPRAAGGRCVSDAASWGEPWRGGGAVAECADAFPVVHLRGGGVTVLRGPARVQGTLLVDGDLAIEGAVAVAGVVLVQGVVGGAGALALDGALLGRGAPGARRSTVGSGSVLRGSGCAVTRATLAASRPILVGRRSWSEVTHGVPP